MLPPIQQEIPSVAAFLVEGETGSFKEEESKLVDQNKEEAKIQVRPSSGRMTPPSGYSGAGSKKSQRLLERIETSHSNFNETGSV